MSRRKSWQFVFLLAMVIVPWLLLNLVFMIHSGGIMVLHTLWLLAFGSCSLALPPGLASGVW